MVIIDDGEVKEAQEVIEIEDEQEIALNKAAEEAREHETYFRPVVEDDAEAAEEHDDEARRLDADETADSVGESGSASSPPAQATPGADVDRAEERGTQNVPASPPAGARAGQHGAFFTPGGGARAAAPVPSAMKPGREGRAAFNVAVIKARKCEGEGPPARPRPACARGPPAPAGPIPPFAGEAPARRRIAMRWSRDAGGAARRQGSSRLRSRTTRRRWGSGTGRRSWRPRSPSSRGSFRDAAPRSTACGARASRSGAARALRRAQRRALRGSAATAGGARPTGATRWRSTPRSARRCTRGCCPTSARACGGSWRCTRVRPAGFWATTWG